MSTADLGANLPAGQPYPVTGNDLGRDGPDTLVVGIDGSSSVQHALDYAAHRIRHFKLDV
jgi:hypothetical protein